MQILLNIKCSPIDLKQQIFKGKKKRFIGNNKDGFRCPRSVIFKSLLYKKFNIKYAYVTNIWNNIKDSPSKTSWNFLLSVLEQIVCYTTTYNFVSINFERHNDFSIKLFVDN